MHFSPQVTPISPVKIYICVTTITCDDLRFNEEYFRDIWSVEYIPTITLLFRLYIYFFEKMIY